MVFSCRKEPLFFRLTLKLKLWHKISDHACESNESEAPSLSAQETLSSLRRKLSSLASGKSSSFGIETTDRIFILHYLSCIDWEDALVPISKKSTISIGSTLKKKPLLLSATEYPFSRAASETPSGRILDMRNKLFP